ncbi:MAG: transcriptional regulator [Magnetospirillum sp.]
MTEQIPLVRNRRPREPGYLLATYYLEPRGISVTRFAQATEAQYWLNLQNAVDLFDARQKVASNPTVEAGVFAPTAAE